MAVPGILLDIILLSLGIAILVKASDIFIDSAVSTARALGTSEHFIGITLVAVATSLPELAVSVTASIRGNGGIAIGNVLGSNVANIALVLGISAVFFPLVVSRRALRDSIVMSAAMVLLWIVMLTGNGITRAEGLLLLFLYIGFAVAVYMRSADSEEAVPKSGDAQKPAKYVLLTLLMGLAIVLGANMTVQGASGLALAAGIPPLVIGGTVVALGTSLPELTASVASSMKKFHGIAVGNIIGSNIFNTLFVMGASAAAAPLVVGIGDLGVTMALVVILSLMVCFFSFRRKIGRISALLLLALYVAFIIGLVTFL